MMLAVDTLDALHALDALYGRYLGAQLAGDRREAMYVVLADGLGAGATVRQLQTHVIQAAQEEIGRLWQLNQVTIAQEHMATAISQLALSALFERARPKPAIGKKLVLACVEGEHHDLPARMVADSLDLAGFDMRYLGANVPHDDLVQTIAAEAPDAIGLSVTMSCNLGSLRIAVTRLRAITKRSIFIGGRATQGSRSIADELGVETAGHTHAELVATTHRLVGLP